jgi:hypothetical protein
MMTDYFTIDLKVKPYNWTINIYEPTVHEYEQLAAAASKKVISDLEAELVKIIKSWDCTDRAGKELPIDAEGIKQIPQSVLMSIANKIIKLASEGISDPKDGSESSPTTPPEQEESSQKPA